MVELLSEKRANANDIPYAVDDKPFLKRVKRIVKENKFKSMFIMMRGLPLDHNYKFGQTALQAAAQNGHLDVVKLPLNGADRCGNPARYL